VGKRRGRRQKGRIRKRNLKEGNGLSGTLNRTKQVVEKEYREAVWKTGRQTPREKRRRLGGGNKSEHRDLISSFLTLGTVQWRNPYKI